MQYPGPDSAQISRYWVWKRPRRQVGSESEKECHVVMKWQQMRLLIIDEISMIDAGLFDKIEEVARIVRNNEPPVGSRLLRVVISTSCRQSTRTARRGFVLKGKVGTK